MPEYCRQMLTLMSISVLSFPSSSASHIPVFARSSSPSAVRIFTLLLSRLRDRAAEAEAPLHNLPCLSPEQGGFCFLTFLLKGCFIFKISRTDSGPGLPEQTASSPSHHTHLSHHLPAALRMPGASSEERGAQAGTSAAPLAPPVALHAPASYIGRQAARLRRQLNSHWSE